MDLDTFGLKAPNMADEKEKGCLGPGSIPDESLMEEPNFY